MKYFYITTTTNKKTNYLSKEYFTSYKAAKLWKSFHDLSRYDVEIIKRPLLSYNDIKQ